MKAVRYHAFGGLDVLHVEEVERPAPANGQVIVRIEAAGINPGEAGIRRGEMSAIFPSTFPSGQGSDLAGVVVEVGGEVDRFAVGDEVIGFSDKRDSQAEFVAADVGNLTLKPKAVPWKIAGALYVAGVTAYRTVRSVELTSADTVVVSAAAGGVGSLAVQLARHAGATVIGLASRRNHAWLQRQGVIPMEYGTGVVDSVKATAQGGVSAFIDAHGGGYVELALDLGVDRDRIDTTADFAAAAKYGVKTEPGSRPYSSAEILAELAGLITKGKLEVPIANVYPLADVQRAYAELENGHTHGKIVLVP